MLTASTSQLSLKEAKRNGRRQKRSLNGNQAGMLHVMHTPNILGFICKQGTGLGDRSLVDPILATKMVTPLGSFPDMGPSCTSLEPTAPCGSSMGSPWL